MKKTLVETSDGSLTLFVPGLNEHYHSTHGALQEAMHVFINNGIEIKRNLPLIRVIEMGFGTGLNAYLTMKWARENKREIHYVGIEAFPVEKDTIAKCLHALGEVDLNDINFISQVSYGKIKSLGAFSLEPILCSWDDIEYNNSFDVVYYDAFGPRVQEELWNEESLFRAYSALKPGGLFTTYCAKGQVKRILKKLGFEVRSIDGPPGKREMTQAIKL